MSSTERTVRHEPFHRPICKSGEMISDKQIYQAATVLIEKYGEDAPIEAALRADELLDRGDIDGERVWIKIGKAVDELLATERPKGAKVH